MPALPPSFLIQATFPVEQLTTWPKRLSWKHWDTLTPIAALATLDVATTPLAIRVGWHENGLIVGVQVTGRKNTLAAYDNDPGASDSVVLCFDTRDTKSIHRAGRFCHRFRFLPVDFTGKANPHIHQEPVPRAREDAAFNELVVRAEAELTDDGYRMIGVIPAKNMTGYDPLDSPRIGFFAQLRDSEHGDLPFSGDTLLPAEADPSMWSTIELTS